MIEKLQPGDTVIVPNNIKINILKEMTSKKILVDVKFYSLKEFRDNYFGSYSKEALYFLMKRYQLTYDVALEYLDNLFYNYEPLKDIYNTLKENNYLIFNPYFKERLQRIVVIGYPDLDKYIIDELNKYDVIYLETSNDNYQHQVYEFMHQQDEVLYVAGAVRELIKQININDIYIISSDEYNEDIKRIFSLYNIPVNFNGLKKIYGTETVKIFLERLIEFKDVNESLEGVPNNEIKDVIINILNSYSFIKNVDDCFLEIIKYELKKAGIKMPKLKKGVNIINNQDIIDTNKYYFWLGFREGNVPKIIHDDCLIKDSTRKVLGLNTSLERFKNAKKQIINLVKSLKNLTITYSLKNYYNTFYPSNLLSDMGLKIIKNPPINLIYSNQYNLLKLGMNLDKLAKYNEEDSSLRKLLKTYPDNLYNTYDNKFKGIDLLDLKEYLKDSVNLSYTSMNNYYLCSFRFYIANILKLDPYEEKFSAFLGSLFHDCLSHMYDENFDLKSSYDNYLQNKELTNKEKFFTKKLYPTLEFIINTIRYQDSLSDFKKTLTEQEVPIAINKEINVNFTGFIDKIKYLEENNQKLAIIVDYKTGNVEATLDNINYGLHLQLPVYIYLAKNKFPDMKIVGFYLQKILHNPPVDCDSDDDDLRKKLRLEGYTLGDEEIISKLDHSYVKSDCIKGLSLTKNGFSHFAKLISEKDIDKIYKIVEQKIEETIHSIETGNFKINPKRLQDKNIGCEFCKFKEICYLKEEDIENLEYKKYEDIGGEENA